MENKFNTVNHNLGFPKTEVTDKNQIGDVEMEKIDHSKVAITGSVHFPSFGVEDSETIRGDHALRSIETTLKADFGVIVVVTGITNADYRSRLKSLKSFGKLTLLDEALQPDEDAHSYGVSRRQAIEESKKQGFAYVMSGEFEKEDLLVPENLDMFIKSFENKNVGMALMNRRGFMERQRNLELNNLSGLPEAQYYGEYSQNYYIWENWKDAGFAVPEVPFDLLNGTRFTVNEEMTVAVDGKNYQIRPSDLMELRYHYKNEEEIGFPYKVDHYSAAIYHSPTMWMALAGEEGFESVEIDYHHPEEQTRIEEGVGNRETFEVKRLEQKRAIVLQNFDLCCNIVSWKDQGIWPTVVTEAIKNNIPLELKHYDIRDWKLENGKILKREDSLL